MVFQSYELFPHKTILENVILAPLKVQKRTKEDAVSEAKQLLEKVGLLDKCDSFPRQLSGGQKQRSSIARALIKNAPILILDDSLSAVDTDTEEHILHNLRDDRKGKTTILIAHRISTVQHADLIMVLENGEMKELGTHTELIQKNGIYKDMFEKQQLEASIGEQEVAIR